MWSLPNRPKRFAKNFGKTSTPHPQQAQKQKESRATFRITAESMGSSGKRNGNSPNCENGVMEEQYKRCAVYHAFMHRMPSTGSIESSILSEKPNCKSEVLPTELYPLSQVEHA
ncbi:Hypothetical predicted protein [Olea europaea subsp. europaea]|uniref:Uncharacterized protein n=1 Tax=Olea europaea subsp. europaea TaxID=158383 RepID=A0A8S0U7L2_OLEEU|nr:Hypothetical predicted protein [Olea europaea subsp. europaea]